MGNTIPKSQLRKSMRTKRLELSSQQLFKAKLALAKHAQQSNQLLSADRILSYAPFAGEISPEQAVNNLATRAVYFPRIINFRTCHMQFFRADRLESLNKYGIVEPARNSQALAANAFDVILMPLVAFDRAGTRVGMGAGYYDRALASLTHQHSTKPYLVGLAHHFQEVNSLEPAPWDVPLDAILTDREFIHI